jgi:SAM-dependent methyltransferase
VNFLRFLRAKLASPPDPFFVSRRSRDRISALIQAASANARILNIGAGKTNLGKNVLNVDIARSDSVDVVASMMYLPFRDDTIDLVIAQGVLEHVVDVRAAMDECVRVIRPGGLFYAEIPFLEPYHEAPIDMRRTTLPGFEQLCLPLKQVDCGIHIGPASTFTWFIREFLARLISGNDPVIFRRVFSLIGWLVFPLKYADVVLEQQESMHAIASSFYYVGQKR